MMETTAQSGCLGLRRRDRGWQVTVNWLKPQSRGGFKGLSLSHVPVVFFFLDLSLSCSTHVHVRDKTWILIGFVVFCFFVASETACTMKTETCFELERRKDATRKLTKRRRHFLKKSPFLENLTRYLLYTRVWKSDEMIQCHWVQIRLTIVKTSSGDCFWKQIWELFEHH